MCDLEIRQISTKLNQSKLILVVILLSLLLSMGHLTAFAHGGEDHGEEKPNIPIVNNGEVVSKLAKTSKAEVFIKYTAPKPSEPTTIKIFLTDLITNSSLDKIGIRLQVQNISPLATQTNITLGQIAVEATPTSTSGVYEAKLTFPTVGIYKMILALKGSEMDAQALISDIIVPESTASPIAITNPYSSLLVITIMVVAMIILIIFYLFSLPQSSNSSAKMSRDAML